MEIINSIAYAIWGEYWVNRVYGEVWEHFGIDPIGFWIGIAIAWCFLIFGFWMVTMQTDEEIKQSLIRSKNERTTI